MRRSLLLGSLLFVAFAVALAPAGLMRQAVRQVQGLDLLNPQGTVWNGNAELYIAGSSAGQIAWSFRPVTILQAELGYDVQLEGPQQSLRVRLAAAPGRLNVQLTGTVQGGYVNQWLAPYDIGIGGTLAFQAAELGLAWRQPAGADPSALATGSAAGTLTWDGGAVAYTLSGRRYNATLPALEARLGPGLEAVAYEQGGQTPLLTAAALRNGFVRLGVTRRMTDLLNNPWPGSSAPHEVVLEVEEQLF
ncbi:MAG: type II secretion system protein N [Pseudomonadales bacterium]